MVATSPIAIGWVMENALSPYARNRRPVTLKASQHPDRLLSANRIMQVATIRWDFPRGHADERSAQGWDKIPGL